MKKKGFVIGGLIILAGAAGAGGWYYYKENYGDSAAASGEVAYVTKISTLLGEDSGVLNRFAGVVEPQETVKVNIENNRTLKRHRHSDCVCCPYYIDLFLDRHYKSCFFPYFYGSAADRRESGLGISFSHRNDSHGSGTVDCYVDSAGIFPEDQWKAGYGWKCHLHVENTENACRIFFTAHGRGYSGTQEYQCFCCRRAGEYVCAAGFEFADDDFLSGGYDKVQSCSYADGCNLCISESASF